jgi:hypothetical protein
MTDEEIVSYARDFLLMGVLGEGIHGQTMERQGIIAQPYVPEFASHGELKIAVVDGEITLARRNNPMGDGILKFSKDCIEIIEPTEEVSELAKTAFREYNKIHPVHFMRVDMVGTPGNIMISEMEAINPSFATRFGIFSEEQVENHYRKLLSFAD